MVREKIKRKKMRNRAGKRAWEFEIRVMRGRGELFRECRKENRDGEKLIRVGNIGKEIVKKERSRCEGGRNEKRKGRWVIGED